ncbi:MAG: hypothetical protein JWM59_1701 [Verrucomicrobiales bacterium]|nr:hypothetical protein [Verrucomicrobiales bacterium]
MVRMEEILVKREPFAESLYPAKARMAAARLRTHGQQSRHTTDNTPQPMA